MPPARIYLDAVIEPPRSLSERGFLRVMVITGGASALLGAGFLVQGAWPITGFFGLEVLALWLVFRFSFSQQTARTFVTVTADTVDLRKIDRRGRVRRAQLPAPFARVELDSRVNGPHALRVRTSARVYAIGEFLNPQEREGFARRLDQALADARLERHRDSDDGND